MVEGSVTLTRRARSVLFLLIVLAVAALAIGPAGIVQQAQARWKSEFASAPYATWYAQQHDREGWSCCDRADAHPVYDALCVPKTSSAAIQYGNRLTSRNDRVVMAALVYSGFANQIEMPA